MSAGGRGWLAEAALLGAGACSLFARPSMPHFPVLALLMVVGLLLAASALETTTGRAAMAAGLCVLVWPVVGPPTNLPVLIAVVALLCLALPALWLRGDRPRLKMTHYSSAAIWASLGVIALAAILFLALRARYHLEPALLWGTIVQAAVYLLIFTAATAVFNMHDGLILAMLLLVRALLSLVGSG